MSAMTKNEFHYQTALGQLEEQERHKRILEVKAVAILGVATTLLGYVLLVSGSDLLPSETPSIATVVAGAVGAGAYVIISVAAVWTLAVTDWKRSPDLCALRCGLRDRPLDEVIGKVGLKMEADVEHNERKLGTRRVNVTTALVALPVLAVACGAFASSL